MSHFKPGAIKVRHKTRLYGNFTTTVKPKTVEVITLKRLTPSIRLVTDSNHQPLPHIPRNKR